MSNVISNALKKIRSLGILNTIKKDTSDHIGINFGNYNSSIAIMEEGKKPKIIKKLSTVKLFSQKDCPENFNFVSFGVKQLLGRKFNDPVVAKEIKRDSFMKKIVKGDNEEGDGREGDALYISSDGFRHSPSVLLAMVLKELRVEAELYLGRPVKRAVIAIPSWFEEAQIMAAMKSCDDAGISKVRVVSEAAAAAISFGMCKKKEGYVFAVVDMGERTLDVSILQVSNGEGGFISKGPVHSDLLLGGVEFDNVLLEFILLQLKTLEGKDVVGDQAIAAIRFTADTYKKQLSSEEAISIPFMVPLVLTRMEFDSLVNHLIQKIKVLCTNCLKDAGITAKDVDEVLLVGGMARVPVVQKAVTEIFEKCPSTGVEPDEAVALGAAAAIQAGVVGDNNFAF